METAKIKELVSRMTLEEKASLCSGLDFWHTKGVERLGIPSEMVSDGPHGLRKQDDKADHLGINDSIQAVCFPAGCATASSFNRELVTKLGETLGEECQAENVSTILGPAMNIKRSPLCGRNFEYYSEDPLLAGSLAAAVTKGVQSKAGCGVTIKHFACNNQEDNRYFVNAHVSERALREIYLKGFEIAVREAQPLSIMTSYNLLNGIHTANSHDLIQGMARDEWGFKGVVMTDWFTSQDMPMITGKFKPAYPISASTGCIYAGNDIQMPGCQKNVDDIVEAVKTGKEIDGYKITKADLQFNAANVIRVAARTM